MVVSAFTKETSESLYQPKSSSGFTTNSATNILVMDEPTLKLNHLPRGPGKPLKEFGDYEIEGELGRGGMGIVYLAKQKNLNRRVALKMLTGHYGPDELRRFLEGAETASGLSHTNIAHIYEVGE